MDETIELVKGTMKYGYIDYWFLEDGYSSTGCQFFIKNLG